MNKERQNETLVRPPAKLLPSVKAVPSVPFGAISAAAPLGRGKRGERTTVGTAAAYSLLARARGDILMTDELCSAVERAAKEGGEDDDDDDGKGREEGD